MNSQNYKYHNTLHSDLTFVFLHGLFGDKDNLNSLAKLAQEKFDTLQIDLLNHGNAPKFNKVDFNDLNKYINSILISLNIKNIVLIGHSLGGKVAMQYSHKFPLNIKALIIMDIAPKDYPNHHLAIFKDLIRIKNIHPQKASEIKDLLSQENKFLFPFLSKSFIQDSKYSFKFNITGLLNSYEDLIMKWQKVNISINTLFLKGEKSNYIDLLKNDSKVIQDQFKQSSIKIIPNSDHYIHVENLNSVKFYISEYLLKLKIL
ncbi:MAG: alpha/beta fold hydrolase [Psittacicella sp.]